MVRMILSAPSSHLSHTRCPSLVTIPPASTRLVSSSHVVAPRCGTDAWYLLKSMRVSQVAIETMLRDYAEMEHAEEHAEEQLEEELNEHSEGHSAPGLRGCIALVLSGSSAPHRAIEGCVRVCVCVCKGEGVAAYICRPRAPPLQVQAGRRTTPPTRARRADG